MYSKLSAGQSLFTGSHFRNLAAYLQLPYEVRRDSTQNPNLNPNKSNQQTTEQAVTDSPYKFVSLYNLDPLASARVRHFDSVAGFESAASNLLSNSTRGQLLFMRGHPSPEWLLAIGATYQVDPEFFLRHLNFRLARPDSFPLPSLPSTGISSVHLRLSTIGGARFQSTTKETQKELDSLRAQNVRSLQNYHEKLRSHSESKLGDSIVRERSIHDSRHFTIEQDMSIYVTRTEKSWIGM